MLSELALQNQYPKTIVHLWSVTEENEPLSENRYQTIQQLGFYSLLYLAKALDKQDSTAEVQIEVVSNQIQAVTGEEFLCPEKATILGPVKVIPQEYPNIHCHSIDIVLPKSGSEAQLIEQLLAELTHHHENYLLPVAFRGYSRWEQSFATQRLNKPANNTIGLRKQGVYLITGGLGGIGLIFAEYLAKTVQAKLVLISRSGLPPREEWGQYLSNNEQLEQINKVERFSTLKESDNETQRLQNQIRQVVALEKLGTEVMVLRADVADLTQMQSAYTQATAQFGEIHGVIHTAVTKGGAIIRAKAVEIAEQEFSPKIKGTRTLEMLFKTAKLDFMMLCSSQNAIIGGNWMVGYSAASAFLDAFAQAKANELDTFIFAINWDRWQGIGRAVDVETGYQARTGKTLTGGLTAQEGVEAFHRILAKRTLPQVIISKQFDFTALAKNPNSLFELFNMESSRTSKTYTRTTEQNTYVAPRNEMEQNIAHIWQETLGIESIGIHEDFYDLGGDSLIAIRVVSRLRELYHIELPVRVLFEKTTIAELAGYIEKTVQTVQHLTTPPTDKNNRTEGEL
ncbi:Polyketide synthase KR domain [Beggiatoa sp. PS]|nr:Polyketide synthase KR domain [Beggiatoa sp. PS]